MFFLLSKIFWFFVQPLNLAIFLLGGGLVASLFWWRKLMAMGAGSALLILAVATWTSLGQALLNPLEERFQRPNPAPEKVDGIVVLGGALEGSINLARGGYEVNAGGDRYIETAVLARRYPQARIVVSGGTGTLFLEGEGDGATAPRLLTSLGVDPVRLILENESRNTFENAVFTRRLVTPKPGETWLLVTRPSTCRARWRCSARRILRCCPGRSITGLPAGRPVLRRQRHRFAAGDDARHSRMDRSFLLIGCPGVSTSRFQKVGSRQ